MQIKNPSNKAIENIKIFGVLYSIEAEGTLDNVPEEHARYWQENLHKFLVLRKDKEVAPEPVQIPTPPVTEVASAPSVQDPEVIAEVLETPAEVTAAEVVTEEVVVPTKSKGRPKKVK